MNNGQKVSDINLSGLGVADFPVILQSGRRTAIEELIKKRNMPFEITAYMLQGDFQKTKYLSD
jgi:hypothetical protein